MKHIFSLFVALVCAMAVFAQKEDSREEIDARWFKSHYTKTECMIPMRDGSKLYTAIFTPKNKKALHPILLNPTQNGCEPYGKKSATFWQEEVFAEYLRAEYIFVFQDVRSSGKSVDTKPGAGSANDVFDTVEWLLRKVRKHNGSVGVWGIAEDGAYALAASGCGHPAIKAVSVQAPVDCVVSQANAYVPTLFVGGGFDTKSNQCLWDCYGVIKEKSPNLDVRLVVGAWKHGAWRANNQPDELEYDSLTADNTANFYSCEVEFPFFDHYLRGAASSGASAAGALIYFTGENCWREMDCWRKGDKSYTLYLNEDGFLYNEQPRQSSSFVNNSEGVLTFVSPVLDSDVIVAGAVEALLHVMASHPTEEIAVKIIDVAEDGEKEILLRSATVAGQSVDANRVMPLAIKMTDLAHTFMAGHRVKIQIEIPAKDKTCDMKLFHDKSHLSQILFSIQ